MLSPDQKTSLQILFVLFGVFGIYAFTVISTPVHHYCDWTGLEIQDRIGHEVTFIFENGTKRYYCSVNVSLLAFQELKIESTLSVLNNIQVRCPMCGMLMDWNDPMIVWVFAPAYTDPTTGNATIVPLCEDVPEADLCESHFLDLHGGEIITCPYEWT